MFIFLVTHCPEGFSSSTKGKDIADTPSKTKTPNLKKNLKPLGSGESVSGKKQVFQIPLPRLKIDLISTYQGKIVIPHISKGFERGKIDNTLFVRKVKGHIILVQIYINDIIFGSTNPSLCNKFLLLMQSEYQMSMMGELTYFLGLQIKQ